jgi:hypothetical protein
MTGIEDFGEYTGFEGSLTVGGPALADVQFDCKWARGDAEVPMGSGRRSKKQLPGEFKVTTKIRKVFVHEDAPVVLGYSLNDTPLTGTAGSRLAATDIAADVVTAVTTSPATPSRVKITTSVGATVIAGQIIVSGTDQSDNQIVEKFDIPALTPSGTVFTGAKVFKTTTHATVINCTTSDGAKYAVDSLAGAASYTVGNPKVFDLIGSLTKGSKVITVTLVDCWFKNGGISWTDVSKVVDVDLDVGMYDPDEFEVDVTG